MAKPYWKPEQKRCQPLACLLGLGLLLLGGSKGLWAQEPVPSATSSEARWRAGVKADQEGDFAKATRLLQDALRQAEAEQDRLHQIRCRNSLSIVSQHGHNFRQAETHARKALAMQPAHYDSLLWADCLNSLANAFIETSRYDSAQAYYLQALKLKEELGDQEALPVVLMNLAAIGWRTGKMDQALKYDLQALELHQRTGNRQGEAEASNNLAYVYRAMGRLEEARRYAEAGLQLARETGERNIQLGCLINLSTISARLGNHEAGFDYQRQYIYLKDSLYNEANQRLTSEMEAKFENERKEHDLALQAETITRQEAGLRLRGLLIVGIVLLLLLSVGTMFYLFQRRRWRLEQQRQEAERLKALDAFKSRFFTHLTHEFRTPLTVILGLAGEHAGEVDWEMTRRNARHLLQLINQLLDLSKLEADQLPLHWTQVDAVAQLRYLTEAFRSLAEQKGQELHFQPAQASFLTGLDQEKVQAIFVNLLGNALKFTPAGGRIELRVWQEAENWAFSVTDDGPGIPAEAQEQVFVRFAQLDSQAGGTGIGLTLAHELSQLMGGSLILQSEPGEGSTFTCRLPLREGTPEGTLAQVSLPVAAIAEALPVTEARWSQAEDERPHLLLVEDQADVVAFLQRCLEERYRISVARNGAEGIEMALESLPDAIVSDVMMPEKDGFELCQALKQDECSSHIPIILLTARAAVEDRLQGLRHGADAYLPKPFEREELLIRLEQLILLRRKLQLRYQNLAELAPADSEAVQGEDAFIQKVRAQVLAHLEEEDFSVEKLAEQLHLSRTQLFRKLKALTGRSVSQFVNLVRIEEAKVWLRDSELTVSEVAYRVGFAEPSYFMRVFAKETEMTAGQWREEKSEP